MSEPLGQSGDWAPDTEMPRASVTKRLRAERDRYREALEDLIDSQYDFPTDLSRMAPEWNAAFERAKEALAGA